MKKRATMAIGIALLVSVVADGGRERRISAMPVIEADGQTVIWVSKVGEIEPGEERFISRPDAEWVGEFPLEARRTIANADWMFRYIEGFAYIERRQPSSYEELVSSVYMPSPEALVNPYTNEPVRQVSEPAPGDFDWSVERFREPSGETSEVLKVGFYFDPTGHGERLERYEIQHSTVSLPEMDDEVAHRIGAWLGGLSEMEKRAYWMCSYLREELDWAGDRFLGGKPARTFAGYSVIGWRFPESVMPNLWEGRPMRAVPVDQPSQGDFSYGWWPDNGGEPAVVELKCYGEGGRLIYSEIEPILQESFALEESLGLEGDIRVFPRP